MGGVLIGCSGSVAPPALRSVLPAGHGVKCLGHSPTGMGVPGTAVSPLSPPPRPQPWTGPQESEQGPDLQGWALQRVACSQRAQPCGSLPFQLRGQDLQGQAPAQTGPCPACGPSTCHAEYLGGESSSNTHPEKMPQPLRLDWPPLGCPRNAAGVCSRPSGEVAGSGAP